MAARNVSRKSYSHIQHPGIHVYQTYPLNVGAPLEVIRQAFVPLCSRLMHPIEGFSVY